MKKSKSIKSELQSEMIEWMDGKYTPYVYAVIKGVHMHLTEIEVRYIQVKCLRETLSGRAYLEEFAKDYVIYSGPTKDYPIMKWSSQNPGFFTTKFPEGFMDAAGRLYNDLAKLRSKDALL